MNLGSYVDGRTLTYDEGAGVFAVGGTPVTVEQLRGYAVAGQIAWLSDEYRQWFYSAFPASSSSTRCPDSEEAARSRGYRHRGGCRRPYRGSFLFACRAIPRRG